MKREKSNICHNSSYKENENLPNPDVIQQVDCKYTLGKIDLPYKIIESMKKHMRYSVSLILILGLLFSGGLWASGINVPEPDTSSFKNWKYGA